MNQPVVGEYTFNTWILKWLYMVFSYTRWWFETCFCSPIFGEDDPILTSIFFKGVVQPRTRREVFLPWDLSDHETPPFGEYVAF